MEVAWTVAIMAYAEGYDAVAYALMNRSIRERITIPAERFDMNAHNDDSLIELFRFT
ncbi:unnamed protein product, partial [Aphanomyces euteiches]